MFYPTRGGSNQNQVNLGIPTLLASLNQTHPSPILSRIKSIVHLTFLSPSGCYSSTLRSHSLHQTSNPTSNTRPYFALIIRAIGVLEGIALVGDPDFAIIDEVPSFVQLGWEKWRQSWVSSLRSLVVLFG